MREERISFKNSLDYTIQGILRLPDHRSDSMALVVFAHGLNSSRASEAIQRVSARLVEQGMGALLFDFTGFGESEGASADATVTQHVDDLENALGWLRADGRYNPIGLYGEITGGTVALRVAAKDNMIRALVLHSPRADADLVMVQRVVVPTLIIQGSADLEVRVESSDIYRQLTGKKKLHIVAGAGHLLDERPAYMSEAVDEAVNWFVENLSRARKAGA